MSEDLHGRERPSSRAPREKLVMYADGMTVLFGLVIAISLLGIAAQFFYWPMKEAKGMWLFHFAELLTLSAIGLLVARFCRVWASEDR